MAANQKRKQEILTLIVVFTGVVIVSALVAYYLGGRPQSPAPATPSATRPDANQPTETPPGVDIPSAILGERSAQPTPSPAQQAPEVPSERASDGDSSINVLRLLS